MGQNPPTVGYYDGVIAVRHPRTVHRLLPFANTDDDAGRPAIVMTDYDASEITATTIFFELFQIF